jgi:hypothetical protein
MKGQFSMNTNMNAKDTALIDESPSHLVIEPVSVLFFVLGLILAATLMHSIVPVI